MADTLARRSLHRSLRLLTAATIVLYGVVLVLMGIGWRAAEQSRDSLRRNTAELRRDEATTSANAASTGRALCAFRHDLVNRVVAGEKFLADHPAGVGGIPAAAIRLSIDNSRRTIRSLEPQHCPPDRPKP